jgi:choice-of-anchor A domain-containing protein
MVDKKLSPPAKAAHASRSKIEQKCELYASGCLGNGTFRISKPKRQEHKRRQSALAALRIPSTVRLCPLLVGALSIALLSGQLRAGTIGAAQGFGAFIFGNSSDSTDIASRIAIGGNGPAGVMPVGDQIQAGPTILTANPNVVAVVEGSAANGGINISSGQAGYNAGGAVHNGTALASDPFLVPANGGQSISSYKSSYVNLSTQLGALSSTPGTSITSNQGLQLNSTGVSATTVVYNLTSAQWAGLGGFSFNSNQTIIVNVSVSGSVTGGTSYNLTANGSQPGNTGTSFGAILFNFVGATGTVNLGNEGYGTILAPNALVQNGGEVVNGQIIANTLANIGELHDGSSFSGTLAGASGTPEPGTLLLLGGGLLALRLFGKRFVKPHSRADG